MSRVSPGSSQAENGNPGDGTQPTMPDQLTDNVSGGAENRESDTDGNNDSSDTSGANPLDGLASMPDIQPHAIEAAGETHAAAKAANAAFPGFDPNIHEVDPLTGEPRKTKAGGFRMKRGRGAKSFGGASTFKAAGPAPAAQAAQSAQSQAERNAKIDSTATIVSEMIFMGGKLLGGEEWTPVTDKASGVDERAMMKGAWAEYFRIRGIIDVPPEIMLAVAIGGYAAPRFFLPKTQSRVQRAKEWLYTYVARRRARRGYTRESQAMDTSAFSHPMTP